MGTIKAEWLARRSPGRTVFDSFASWAQKFLPDEVSIRMVAIDEKSRLEEWHEKCGFTGPRERIAHVSHSTTKGANGVEAHLCMMRLDRMPESNLSFAMAYLVGLVTGLRVEDAHHNAFGLVDAFNAEAA